MKGRKPFRSRLKAAFLAAAAFLGTTTSTILIEQLPKDPVTDTQKITTFDAGTSDQRGYNISPIDQIWKHTLGLRGETDVAKTLLKAAEEGDSWRVRAIMEDERIDPDFEGVLAMKQAAFYGHRDVMDALAEKGVRYDAVGGMAFVGAMQGGQRDLAVEILHKTTPSSARLNQALQVAAMQGDYELSQLLIDRGADVGADNSAALTMASMKGHTDIVRLILAQETVRTVHYDPTTFGPLPFDVDYYRDTYDWIRPPYARNFLPSAAAFSHQYCVLTADVNANHSIALRLAAASGHTDVVRLLVAAGANINGGDGIALANAVAGGHQATVNYLLQQKGIDVNAGHGIALYTAVERNNVVMAHMLRNCGADIKAGDGRILSLAKQKNNPWMLASLNESSRFPPIPFLPPRW